MTRAATLLALVLALIAPTAQAGSERGQAFQFFRTPSGNIGCVWSSSPAELRCDILSGLRPEPRGRCQLDWTGLTMRATGRAHALCAGDTSLNLKSRVLGYGQTWRRAGFVCLSKRTGLRCTNRSGHGFQLARQGWRLF